MTVLPDLTVTMRFDPLNGIADLERHLETIRAEAAKLSYPFNRHMVRNELQAATFRLRYPRQVRLLIGPTGAVAIEISPIGVAKDAKPSL